MTKTRESLSIALALTFFGAILLMPEPAQAVNCEKNPSHPQCVATLATVSLTGGAFVFDAGTRDVTLKAKRNLVVARSEQDVDMTRPDEVSFPILAATWDQVFAACSELATGEIPDIFVRDDDWKITFLFDNDSGIYDVRLLLIIRLEDDFGIPTAEITLQLIGVPDYIDDPIPPEGVTPSEFDLTHFAIFGTTERGIHPRSACVPPGGGSFDVLPLLVPSTLSITLAP